MPLVERNYYVICDDNCRFPAMTKEQIIAAIEAATGHVPSEQDIDQAFITKIKELNKNAELQWWVGTEAQYNALSEKDVHTLYIITDVSEYDDFEARISAMEQDLANYKQDVDDEIEDFEQTVEADVVAFKQTCKLKGDFAVITGNITLTNGQGNVELDYPSGFSKDNCVVISAELAMFTSRYDYNIASSTIGVGVQLANKVNVTATPLITVTQAASTKPVKVVLMKV